MTRGRVGFITLVVVFALTGCTKPEPPALDSPPPAAENVGPPVNEQEAMLFGLQLETAMTERDTAAIERLIPMKALYARVTADLDTSRVSTTLRDSLTQRYTREILDILEAGGSYKLVRVHVVDGRPRLFFRAMNARYGLDYDDIALVRNAAGQVVMDDVTPLITGESHARRLRRVTIDRLNRSRKEKDLTTERDKEFRRHAADVDDFEQKMQDRKPVEALALYHKLPDLVRRDRDTELLAVQAAQRAGDDAYVREIREYRRNHPDTPGLDAVSLDEYLITHDWPAATAALDRVEKVVGGDACMTALRAVILARSGRPDEARPIAEQAVKEEPTLTVAYWACIAAAYAEQNHKAALKWLKAIHQERHVPLDFPSIVINPWSKPFARSPQFQELKAWYAARGR